MHRLGDVRSAVIDDDRARRLILGDTTARVVAQRAGVGSNGLVRQAQVDEARARDLELRETRVDLEARHDLLGDRARVGFGRLRRGECAVALELREVGTVRRRDVAVRGVEAFRAEGVGDEIGEDFCECCHDGRGFSAAVGEREPGG